MGFNPTKGNPRAVEKPYGHKHMHPLTILGNTGGMYSESLDVHAASPLYQCLSLEDLDRYLVVWQCSRESVCVCVCFLCGRGVFGVCLIKRFCATCSS